MRAIKCRSFWETAAGTGTGWRWNLQDDDPGSGTRRLDFVAAVRDEIAPPPFPQEGEDIVNSEQALGQVVLVTKKLAAMVSINNELLKIVSKSSPWNEQRRQRRGQCTRYLGTISLGFKPSDRAVEPTHPISTPPEAARQRH